MAEFCQKYPQVFKNTFYDFYPLGFISLRESDGDVPLRDQL
jgi:hypothetical protein